MELSRSGYSLATVAFVSLKPLCAATIKQSNPIGHVMQAGAADLGCLQQVLNFSESRTGSKDKNDAA